MSDEKKPITTQEAMNALGQLSAHGRALAHAQTVLAAMAGSEQVGRELDAAIVQKRALYEDACKKLEETRVAARQLDDDARQNREDARVAAAATAAQAKADAEKILAKAREEASAILGAAQVAANKIDEDMADKKAQLSHLNDMLETAHAEHDHVNAAIEGMRKLAAAVSPK